MKMPTQSGLDQQDFMAQSRSPKWVRERLAANDLLVLDLRSAEEYGQSHIDGAIHLSLPGSGGILLRRLQKGTVSFKCFIAGEEGKETFAKKSKNVPIILYDTNTTDFNANTDSTFLLLLKKLAKDGCRSYYLEGGFASFASQFPNLCDRQAESDSEDEPMAEGFGRLRIDCGSGSENEQEPPLDNLLPVEILPSLFLGSKKDSENLSMLQKLNIKYILNVTPNIPNSFEKNGLIKYKQIPISDHWSQNLAAFFPEAISFIEEAREAKCGVLVHCLAGISRSVTVTVAYLMHKMSLSLNEAYDYVKMKKSNISPNFNFMGQLLDFERRLSNSPCRKGTCQCAAEGRKCYSPKILNQYTEEMHFTDNCPTTPNSTECSSSTEFDFTYLSS
ncbi:dual specificity protein phosphatase 6-like [Anneissia japonica]|uniref:dual specificity protein phosphatase 6-like n=1 Tax=Anneissia japonica TaxID=1529436 RepID=UPI00142567B0|nr:dual specificity protein phosphatase 6-like [Anneissia japonica]